MRLLARVRPDVSCLVLQTVKGFVAERALVGPWELVAHLGGLAGGQGPVGAEHGDGRHVCWVVVLLGGRLRLASAAAVGAAVGFLEFRSGGRRGIWVQQICEIYCGL